MVPVFLLPCIVSGNNSDMKQQKHEETPQIWSFCLEKLADGKKILFSMYFDARSLPNFGNFSKKQVNEG